jgi:hypothetical protein
MIQEVVLNTISSPSFSGGMKITDGGVNNAWGLPEPTPLYKSGGSPLFAAAGVVPPNGMGNDDSCSIYFAWVHGGYFYALINSSLGNGIGCYRYQLDGTDPELMTFDDWQERNLFTDGGTFWNPDGYVFSPADEAVVVQTRNTSGGKDYSLSRHEMSSWKFKEGTATWKIAPIHQSQLVAQGITRAGALLLDRARNRLYVTSLGSCKVLTFNWTSGALVGEWIIPPGGDIAGITQPFRLMGLDQATGNVLGGSFHPNGGNGAIYFWNSQSDPDNWTTVGGAILKREGGAYNQGRFAEYGAAPALLHSYYGRYYVGLQPEDSILFGFNSDDVIAKQFIPQFYGYTYSVPSFLRWDVTDGKREDIWFQRTNSYSRTGSGLNGLKLCHPIYIHDNPWLIFPSQGSIDHYNDETDGPPDSSGIMACHAGIGTNTLDISSLFSQTSTPKKLIISQAIGDIDAEYSAHYAKWRFSVNVNGGGYSAPRSGPAELHNLDQIVNGKSAWGPFLSTDTVTLKTECTSGLVHSFAIIQGNKGDLTTPNVGTADMGVPRDVLVIFQYEATKLIGL